MRQGQQNNNNNKRMRGRNRKGPNPLTRSFESNGGDVKLRGTALHIAEKYVQLARDAQSSGDRVAAENYFQHAEHYYRIVAAAQAQMPIPQPIVRNDEGDDEDEGGDFRVNGGYPGERQQGVPQGSGQPFGAADQQPYLNGASETDDDFNEPYAPQDMGQGGGGGNYAPRDNGGGGGGNNNPRYQGQGGQGQPRQGEGQGQFRRRRPFRERYENRGDRDRNAGGGNGGQGSGPSGGQGGGGDRSEGGPPPRSDAPSSEGNDD